MLSQSDIFKSKGYNVPTFVFDADGKKIEIETREDEEQSLTYQKIVEALTTAGYYRAQIQGITPFDVVVGGMTWCIDTADIDLDVDLLFEDSLTTGQKIALTEKIVVVLPKIQCPYFIEPHQIQGLDFIHILPVIQWLIKWSTDNRARKAAYLEEYAKNEYFKRFTCTDIEYFRRKRQQKRKNIDFVINKYEPRRISKKTDKSCPELKFRLENTLAEYNLASSQNDSKIVYYSESNSNKQFDLAKLNFEEVEHLVSSEFLFKESERKINNLKNELNNLEKEKNRLENELEAENQESAKLAANTETITPKLENLKEEEKKIILAMQQMIQEHDRLKENEKKYKETCQIELEEIEAELGRLDCNNVKEETKELTLQLQHIQDQLENKKQHLGKIVRSVLQKERYMEQIPSRPELSQYQKRFLELYNQVALKHTETKRYIILYNSLNDKHKYMSKELNILNSIQDSYSQVVTSANSKDEFLRQLHDIAKGTDQTREKIITKRNENRRIKENLNDQIQFILKQKNEYANAVKEVAEMHLKNQQLSATIDKLYKKTNDS